MCYIIYKIINLVNNKVYFGYTSKTLQKRLEQHSKNICKCFIRDSIRKYGLNNFIIIPIYQYDNIYAAQSREILLIEQYKSNICRYPNGNGMNMTDGGDGTNGYIYTIKDKIKMSIRAKGRKKTEEHKRKISESHKGKIHSYQTRKVSQYTLEHTLIKTFNSIKSATIETNILETHIVQACKGKYKTSGGYIWKYTQ